jgi:hypothetical protein
MELHPCDGVDRRYRDSDADRTAGLAAVAEVLSLRTPPSADGLRYGLTFTAAASACSTGLRSRCRPVVANRRHHHHRIQPGLTVGVTSQPRIVFPMVMSQATERPSAVRVAWHVRMTFLTFRTCARFGAYERATSKVLRLEH